MAPPPPQGGAHQVFLLKWGLSLRAASGQTVLIRVPSFHTTSPGMPLIYWFSRRMTLWGSISFNLAVFINIIIAFFYPYVEGASTGEDAGLAGRALSLPCPFGQVVRACRGGRSTLALPLRSAPHPGETRIVQWDSRVLYLGIQHTRLQARDQLW